MENDDILREIHKLKEVNLNVQNHLADLEAKVLKSNQKKNRSYKKNENYRFNFQDSDGVRINKPFKFEKSVNKALESNTDVFDLQKFEIIEELYQRSRKHLNNFQKKCDNLLNQVNSHKSDNSKKNDHLYHHYLNNFLSEDDLKSQSHKKHHHKHKSLYQSNSTNHHKSTSKNRRINDFENKIYGNFNFAKEPQRNINYNHNTPGQSYKNNIDFYKKYTLNANNDTTSEFEANSSISSLIESNEYEKSDLFTPDTSESIDNYEDLNFHKNLYFNSQNFHNNFQVNNNIPFQYQYRNDINQKIYDLRRKQKDLLDQYDTSIISSISSTSSSSSDWSMVSAISSSLSTESLFPNY